MATLSCSCGQTTAEGAGNGPPCIGCPTCGTSLRLDGPYPMTEPHQPGPINRDDTNSPFFCRVCGISPPF